MEKKVGVLIIGLNGSIATTMTSGILAIKKGLTEAVGCVTDLPEFEHLNLQDCKSIVFSGWDLNDNSHLESAYKNNVVPSEILSKISDEMDSIKVLDVPLVGVSKSILHMNSINSADILTRGEAVEIIINDINQFKIKNYLDEVVVVNLASTEHMHKESLAYKNLNNFENAINNDDENISSIMLYTYAAIKTGCPFVNFTPSLNIGIPALIEMSEKYRVPISGNDGKTGQTLYKTVISPMLYWRNLRLKGWYSTNLLGNNDGLILNDPIHKEAKINSKTKVLSEIMGYNDFCHQVSINYYGIVSKSNW